MNRKFNFWGLMQTIWKTFLHRAFKICFLRSSSSSSAFTSLLLDMGLSYTSSLIVSSVLSFYWPFVLYRRPIESAVCLCRFLHCVSCVLRVTSIIVCSIVLCIILSVLSFFCISGTVRSNQQNSSKIGHFKFMGMVLSLKICNRFTNAAQD